LVRRSDRKQKLFRLSMRLLDPGRDCFLRLFGDLKLHGPLRLLLHDNRAGGYLTALDNVVDAKPHQFAPTQLAVDLEVEQCEFPGSMIQLQSNPDSPNLLQPKWGFLVEQFAFVPRH
jgi:hypothetical protein